MKTYRPTLVGTALVAVITFININPATAGTKAVVVAPAATTSAKAVVNVQPSTTSAKAVVDVQPGKPAPAPTPVPPPAPAPKPEPRPAPQPVANSDKLESALITLTRLAEEGMKKDAEQDRRLAALEGGMVTLENRVGKVECSIDELAGRVVQLEESYTLLKQGTADHEVRIVQLEEQKSTFTTVNVHVPTVDRIQPVVLQGYQTPRSTCMTPRSTCTTPRASCTTPRTSAVVREIPRSAPSPPPVAAPVTAVNCRPGIITSAWRFLFGAGCVQPAVVRPVMAPPPMLRQPYYPQCPPSFGWRQPPPMRVGYGFSPGLNCGVGYGRGWNSGGRDRGPTVVRTVVDNENSVIIRR